ncbi:hypothetical protein RHMOL_Rhmol04G0232700 [Rhododendron molle]|uniref:Uncharacterized protein n=2 Tax=Rhododendron molle TaxID=49168 RepID=A0ACC0P3Q9_RHOML|nr:hypothetical protein RHMOL_Rhmol04G0232700 [Rhododendron molle]
MDEPLVGTEVDDERVQLLLSEFKGKDITDLIASGREKLASDPSGGGGGGGAAAAAAVAMVASSAGGGAPAAPAASEAKKEEKEEEKEESDGVSLNPIDCIVSGILISVTASFTQLVFYTTSFFFTLWPEHHPLLWGNLSDDI